MDLSNVG